MGGNIVQMFFEVEDAFDAAQWAITRVRISPVLIDTTGPIARWFRPSRFTPSSFSTR